MSEFDRVWKLLEDPKRWTKGTLARDAKGNYVASTSDKAVCWCLTGAIYRIYKDGNGDLPAFQFRRIIKHLSTATGVVNWNDAPERTHAEVLTVLKELDI